MKQHLVAIRMLGDWLVVSQDPHARRLARRQPGPLPANPAAAVRRPKHVVTKGATPVLSPAEARKLLASIDTGAALPGLRDRALLSVMLYSFARVRAGSGTTSRLTNGPRLPSTPTSRQAGSRSRRRRSSRPWIRRGGDRRVGRSSGGSSWLAMIKRPGRGRGTAVQKRGPGSAGESTGGCPRRGSRISCSEVDDATRFTEDLHASANRGAPPGAPPASACSTCCSPRVVSTSVLVSDCLPAPSAVYQLVSIDAPLAAGAQLEARNRDYEQTPLHRAAADPRGPIARLLGHTSATAPWDVLLNDSHSHLRPLLATRALRA